MKKTVLMLAVSGLMLATPSCKKGENDPFMSLASRKGRLAGDYTITGYETHSTSSSTSGSGSEDEVLAGNVVTVTEKSTPTGGSTTTETSTYTLDLAEMTFDKDGNWTMTWNTTTVEVDVDEFGPYTFTTTSTTVATEERSGSWNFLGKVDEYKNKERIVLNMLSLHTTDQTNSVIVTSDGTTSTTDTETGDKSDDTYGFSDGEWSMIFELDQLKGKEVIMKQIGGGSNSFSTTDNSGTPAVTTTYTSTNTFEGWWTLTQK